MTEFRFEQCLGRGGFGEVYRGVMSRGGGVEVDVAIKVLRPDLDPESQGVQRLRDEGRLLGRLTHPAILRVYDLVVVEGRAALVSEYVPGDDLGRLLRTQRLPPRAVFEIVAQVAAALDAAWSWPSVTDGKPLHLVHRDVKPDNIRVDPHGSVKLLDFGIAQAQTVLREAQTRVNTIMGSTHYLAPERLVQQEVGPESDVFALGCTLFEALAGEALFSRKSMRQMYLLMVEERKFEEFVVERGDAFPGRLGGERAIALLRAMIAWRKQNRPTAAEVAARCDAISDSMEGATLTQWCRSRTWPPQPSLKGPLEGFTFESAAPEPVPDSSSSPALSPAPSPAPEDGLPRLIQQSGPVPSQKPIPGEHGLDARPKVLGETSGQGLTDMHTSLKRGIAAHSPHPWAPAEMAAVISSQFTGLQRIPQLLRQLPEPVLRPESATSALTVQNIVSTIDHLTDHTTDHTTDPTVPLNDPPEPPSDTLVPVTFSAELPVSAVPNPPAVAKGRSGDTLVPTTTPVLLSGADAFARPRAEPVQEAPVPRNEDVSPVDSQAFPLSSRERLDEDTGENTASLLETTDVLLVGTLKRNLSSQEGVVALPAAASPVASEIPDPGRAVSIPPESIPSGSSPPGSSSGEEASADVVAGLSGEFPEELPTVRIARKRDLQEPATSAVSAPGVPAPPLLSPQEFASFDDEPPTVPSAAADPSAHDEINGSALGETLNSSMLNPSAYTASASATPSASAGRRTPKVLEGRVLEGRVLEVRSRRGRRPADRRWLVAWGSSLAGLVLGGGLLLFVAVAVWLTAS